MCATSFFFLHAFRKNWLLIQSAEIRITATYVVLSFVAFVITYLLTTFGWFLTLNFLSHHKITFLESIAVVNTSNLIKYIPGKVWSYALQIYWLADKGFSKSLIVFTNLVNLFISLMTAMILGLCLLVLLPGIFPHSVTLVLLVTFVAVELCFVIFGEQVVRTVVSAANKFLKREIEYRFMSQKLIYYLHLIYLAAAFFFGLAAYLLCLGFGFQIAVNKVLLIMSSMMIAEVIGFVSFIAPGGLGVREGLMFLMLNGGAVSALSLVLPVGTRIVSMAVDLFLGTIGLVLFNRLASFRTKL